MTDKELMRMALDTLQGLFGVYGDSGGVAVWQLGGSHEPKEAITALRQANKQVAIETQVPPVSEWVGLIVAEIFDADPCPSVMFDEERIDFARAIETKLKEKNT